MRVPQMECSGSPSVALPPCISGRRFSVQWPQADATASRRATRVGHRRGVTLIEILVTTVITLLIIFAVVRVFAMMGEGMRDGRATLEMSGQLRSTMLRLQQDLDGITVPMLPWVNPDSGLGYFEYTEGLSSDRDSDGNGVVDALESGTGNRDTSRGDLDDILMFTARSRGEPFMGRFDHDNNPSTAPLLIESPIAEVIWSVKLGDRNANDVQETGEGYVLYRRVMLVRPDLDLSSQDAVTFLRDNDISARPNPNGGGMIANSMSDLSRRESRYGHFRLNHPFPIEPGILTIDLSSEYFGDDVILADVLAFDVRAYDPAAPIYVSGPLSLAPGDPGYPPTGTPAGEGAYVDLNFLRLSPPSNVSRFSHGPDPRAVTAMLGIRPFVDPSVSPPVATYDTWPDIYERDGIDQDGDTLVDEGTNGIDDDNINGVDDPGERETSPPYPYPLRGIQVTLRMVDYATRQVRQVSVVSDFVPN